MKAIEVQRKLPFKKIQKTDEIHIQTESCKSPPYSQFKSMCQECKRNGSCTFKNLRGFKVVDTQLLYGPYFTSTSTPDLKYKSKRFNTKPYSRKANTYALKKIRRTLQGTLQRQLDVLLHGSNKPIQRKHTKGYSHTCDTCSTSFFIHYYICAFCAIEICIDCYEALENTLYGYHNGRVFNGKEHSRSEFVLFSKVSEKSMTQLIGSTAMEVDGYLYNEEYDSDDMSIIPSKAKKIIQLSNQNPNSQCVHGEVKHLECEPNKTKVDPSLTYDGLEIKYTINSKQPTLSTVTSSYDVQTKVHEPVKTTVIAASIHYHPHKEHKPVKDGVSEQKSVIMTPTKHIDKKHDPLKDYFNKLKAPKSRQSEIDSTIKPKLVNRLKVEKIELKKSEAIEFRRVMKPKKERSVAEPLLFSASDKPKLNRLPPSIDKSQDYMNLPASQVNLKVFQEYWQTHRPALITNSTSKSKFEWTPQMFQSVCGTDSLQATDFDNKVYELKAESYFSAFSNRKRRQTLCESLGSSEVLKVKDWPPNQDLKNKLPGLYEDFMRTVPAPEYCSATGYLNLANRLPEEYVPPDLGPKLFISYGSDLKGKTGKTNLHCDITDAVNVMYYADDDTVNEKPKSPAVWHIFPYDSLKILKRFIRRYKKCNDLHPIFDHAFYLTAHDLQLLEKKFKLVPYTIYQHVGDTVFIPAGCAHQVTNYSNSIKCAFDFLSPENVEGSLFISKQLRKLNKRDALQIQTTLAYAWLSLKADSET